MHRILAIVVLLCASTSWAGVAAGNRAWPWFVSHGTWDGIWNNSVLLCEFDSNANPAPDTSAKATNELYKAAGTAAPTYTSTTGGISGCWSYDGGDYHTNRSMTGFSSTKGAIFGWFRTGAAAAATDEPRIWGVNTFATKASYSMICPITYYDDGYTAFLHVLDGTVQWNVRAPVVLSTASGWQFVGLIHNGTAPRVWLNSATCTPTWVTSTDLTKWTKAVLTDASSKADCFSAGAVLYQGNITGGAFKGDEDRITIYTNTVTDAQALTLFWRTATNHGYTAWQYANRSGLASSTVCKAAYNFNVSGVAEDTSGNGNHSTVMGNVTWLANGGLYPNGWLDFDGVTDYVDFGAVPDLDPVTNFTVSFWIYPRTTNADDMVWEHLGLTSPFGGWYIMTRQLGKMLFVDFDAGSSTAYSTAGAYTVSNWQHMVLIYKTSSAEWWINGVSNASTSGMSVTSPTGHGVQTRIGLDYPNGSDFIGRLDDMRYFNRVVTANEITNKTTGLYGSTTNWHLN